MQGGGVGTHGGAAPGLRDSARKRPEGSGMGKGEQTPVPKEAPAPPLQPLPPHSPILYKTAAALILSMK